MVGIVMIVATADDVHRIAMSLPRTAEGVVGEHVKYREFLESQGLPAGPPS
jgi:hypothetical protein